MSKQWRMIPCHISELRLDITLACGQSFRWKEIEPGIWRSVLGGSIWTLKQTGTHIFYQRHNHSTCQEEENCDQSGDALQSHRKKRGAGQTQAFKNKKRAKVTSGSGEDGRGNSAKGEEDDGKSSRDILRDYFQLDMNLGELYNQWQKADKNFSKVSQGFPGVRILRQDPVENLISFICSSNNNIARITGMVGKLCQEFGDEVGVLDGVSWHSFPSLAALSGKGVEEALRKMGFGYRAKFISHSAQMMTKDLGGEDWLRGLRGQPYLEAHSELMKLPGVGAKVADCVCLMSLDKRGAIPVDTHVWQIASRDYIHTLQKTKTLTDRTYRQIGDFFRELFGEYAGWAHSVLFSADLKKFQESPSPKPKNGKTQKEQHGKIQKSKRRSPNGQSVR
ncbi:N-glycosylase/DNA lyase-like [Lytechinus pictus]|uniref:N-glycosylase/DNA lyase-like n=1 Tax=Lytechinus pictus TaxID=7653 RepID=UPI0030BA19A7